MEFPAASDHRGLVPWLGLLLAVFPSCLPIWIPPTTAQIAFVSTGAPKGQDVILRIRNRPRDSIAFMWYKETETMYSNLIGVFKLHSGEYLRGPRSSGREITKLDGSLMIRNLTESDEGIYIVIALLQNFKKAIGIGSLSVYTPLSEPILIANNTTVRENEDAVKMYCYSNMRFIYWLFNGTRLQENRRVMLSQDKRALTIDPVRREDAGNYQCKVSNPISSAESEPVVLEVKY